MPTVWDSFWKDKGASMEWTQEDIMNSPAMKEMTSKLLKHLGRRDLKGISLIELGAGMGITSMYFATKGANVSLLDLSKEAKPFAKKYWGTRAKHKFIIADLFKYNPSVRYDVVTSFGVCEHFVGKQRVAILKKHTDLLKSGGVAIISVPHKYGVFYRAAKKLAELTGYWDFGLEVPFSKRELVNFAKANGFSYEVVMGGFYSSAYDLIVRKPLKVLHINARRRFDNAKSLFDYLFGSSVLIFIKKP